MSFSYSELWEKLKPTSQGLPNAGLVFKGQFLRDNPQLIKLFLQETAKAIDWVKQNPKQAALLSYKPGICLWRGQPV